MTNTERLIALLGFQADPVAIEAALLDNSITGSDDYEAANLIPIKKAAIALIEILLSTPDTSNSVTGYSVNYDRGFAEKRLNALRSSAGIAIPGAGNPTIRGVSPW
jgi:hypothetical protein